MSATATRTSTYTKADIERVFRRVGADLKMIADSTGAWDATTAAKYIHDVDELAGEGYLDKVDVTLFSGGVEVKAARFVVNDNALGLSNQRPGDALWPRVANPYLRIVLSHSAAYDTAAANRMVGRLKCSWVSSFDDISHSTLCRGGDRSYASNGFGVERKDWAA